MVPGSGSFGSKRRAFHHAKQPENTEPAREPLQAEMPRQKILHGGQAPCDGMATVDSVQLQTVVVNAASVQHMNCV